MWGVGKSEAVWERIVVCRTAIHDMHESTEDAPWGTLLRDELPVLLSERQRETPLQVMSMSIFSGLYESRKLPELSPFIFPELGRQ